MAVNPGGKKAPAAPARAAGAAPCGVAAAPSFGPKPRDYNYSVPKKVKKAALRSALSSKLGEEKLTVLRGFDLESIKTKDFVAVLSNLAADKLPGGHPFRRRDGGKKRAQRAPGEGAQGRGAKRLRHPQTRPAPAA